MIILKPIEGGRISSPFGPRNNAFHNGIDIAVPVGTPVLAAANGTVSAAGASGGDSGTFVRILHRDGWKTGYAHLSALLVRPGDYIRRGQVIALSGNTGHSTGPHLHFTLSDPAGRWMDPAAYWIEKGGILLKLLPEILAVIGIVILVVIIIILVMARRKRKLKAA